MSFASHERLDRTACHCLVRRFVDPGAEFLYAMPFDMAEGFWNHRGDTCTFDTMITEFGLGTAPLLRLAHIVRAADPSGHLSDEPEAAGLLAVSLGLSRQYGSDLEQLNAGMGIYDAFYRWCRDATDETHAWPAPSRAAK